MAEVGKESDIVLAADVSADGKLVALGGPGKVVKVFSVADGKLIYQIAKHTDWITAIEFSPDGALLATADRSGGIFLWDSAGGGVAGALAEHKDSVTALSWRGDSRLLASGSEDGQIIIWNVGDGFPVATIAKAHPAKPAPGGVLSLQFAHDGRLVSVAPAGGVTNSPWATASSNIWRSDVAIRCPNVASTTTITSVPGNSA